MAKNNGKRVNNITFLVLYLSINGPPNMRPINEKIPKKIKPVANMSNVHPF